MREKTESTNKNYGGRRLTIFGVVAIVLAFVSAGISLFIYTASGDIYLDRSRPGFIFESDNNDEPGDNKPDSETTAFGSDGAVESDDLDEYLEKLDYTMSDITAESDAFSGDALSDETLNITGSTDY